MQKAHETGQPIERGPSYHLRRRIEHAFFELDAVYDLLREEAPTDDGKVRLDDCRYSAARALLLEIAGNDAPPHDLESPWADLRTEGSLIALLVRAHGWRHEGPGQLRRSWEA